MSFLNLIVILFLIMDPVGNISSFINQLKNTPLERQKFIIFREMLIALFTMVLFTYIGEFIFTVLDVSETTVRITIGVLLFLVAIKIIFPVIDTIQIKIPAEEPFINPLAIPLVAGPSLLATIMLFAHLHIKESLLLSAILIAWSMALAVLLSGNFLYKILGKNGLVACERLMGMILALLAIQRFLEGIKQFIQSCI